MPWHRFERATLPATPWKNGGGVTREESVSRTAEEFLVRIMLFS
jgi:environmental stress-induced protein Ves